MNQNSGEYMSCEDQPRQGRNAGSSKYKSHLGSSFQTFLCGGNPVDSTKEDGSQPRHKVFQEHLVRNHGHEDITSKWGFPAPVKDAPSP